MYIYCDVEKKILRHHLQFGNLIEVCKIGTFQRNIFTKFLKVLNIYVFLKIFQKFEILMFR